jgi:hypothetical protein
VGEKFEHLYFSFRQLSESIGGVCLASDCGVGRSAAAEARLNASTAARFFAPSKGKISKIGG